VYVCKMDAAAKFNWHSVRMWVTPCEDAHRMQWREIECTRETERVAKGVRSAKTDRSIANTIGTRGMSERNWDRCVLSLAHCPFVGYANMCVGVGET
jgi:hypothetical protein